MIGRVTRLKVDGHGHRDRRLRVDGCTSRPGLMSPYTWMDSRQECYMTILLRSKEFRSEGGLGVTFLVLRLYAYDVTEILRSRVSSK